MIESKTIAPRRLAEATLLTELVMDPRSERIRLLPARFWQSLDPELVVAWAVLNARWCIVTTELVAWLRERIAGRKAIEIGAGCGDLGYHLGIVQTDNFAHVRDPRMQDWASQAVLTTPPCDVLDLDALDAVERLRPEVVVGAWVTQRGLPIGNSFGAYYQGVRETQLVMRAEYIVIGSTPTHGSKRIMALPHEEHAPPWLVSRAFRPGVDRIWVWPRQDVEPGALDDEVDEEIAALLAGTPVPGWVPTERQIDQIAMACGVSRKERRLWRRGKAVASLAAATGRVGTRMLEKEPVAPVVRSQHHKLE